MNLRSANSRTRGLSLIEILVVLAVGASLVVCVSAASNGLWEKSGNTQCLNRMKQLGNGILLYAQDNDGEFPRSRHSASAANKLPWARTILPYLGISDTSISGAGWEKVMNTFYRCPNQKTREVTIYSYALNVHFELSPDRDDYVGSPSQWRRMINVERPAATILLVEPKRVANADHVMSHFWTRAQDAVNSIDTARHGQMSNYLFVDGHVAPALPNDQYDPSRGIDNWNPSLAGRGN